MERTAENSIGKGNFLLFVLTSSLRFGLFCCKYNSGTGQLQTVVHHKQEGCVSSRFASHTFQTSRTLSLPSLFVIALEFVHWHSHQYFWHSAVWFQHPYTAYLGRHANLQI